MTACVLVFAIAIGSYSIFFEKNDLSKKNPPSSGRSRGALNVTAQIIRQDLLVDNHYTTGTLLPDEEVDLTFGASGKVVAIYFTEGTKVKKGDLLGKVYDGHLQAQLKKLEAQLILAESRVFRQNALLAKDAVSQEAYEQAKTELAAIGADIDLVKSNISLTELYAPFDGVIGLRNLSEGAYASVNAVVAKLTKISPLKIAFSVPERYATEIQEGTNLTFTIDGVLRSYDAKVYATDSKVDVNTRTLTVRALYANSDEALLPGRFANVELKIREMPNAISVPTEALVPEMGVDKVFLFRSGTAQPVEVKTGLRTASRIQIILGLSVGDTLIVSGTLQLRTGLNVTLDQIN